MNATTHTDSIARADPPSLITDMTDTSSFVSLLLLHMCAYAMHTPLNLLHVFSQRDVKKLVDLRINTANTKSMSARMDRMNVSGATAPEASATKGVDVNVVSHHMQRFAVWFGGSVMSSDPSFYSVCHSKQDYDEIGPNICRSNPVFRGTV